MTDSEGPRRHSGELWVLHVDRQDVDGVAVLVARGRVGVTGASDLLAVCSNAIRDGKRSLLLDLQGVDYMSSPGLAALEAIDALCRRAGGALVACSLSEPVRIVLDMSGVLAVLDIEPSQAEALARLTL
jgi:stage II sporulation protein AA (anti-sigma F factor antagonist)